MSADIECAVEGEGRDGGGGKVEVGGGAKRRRFEEGSSAKVEHVSRRLSTEVKNVLVQRRPVGLTPSSGGAVVEAATHALRAVKGLCGARLKDFGDFGPDVRILFSDCKNRVKSASSSA